MDDTDDDARYPPNPYHQNNNSRSQFPSSNRPKITIRATAAASSPQIDRSSRYSKEELEEDESDSEDEDLSGSNQAIENDVEEDDADVDDDEDGDGRSSYQKQPREDESSSPDSRGKRRKLTKFSFEFAPRAAAAAAAAAAPPTPIPLAAVVPSKPPPARKNPTEWMEDSTFVLLDAWGTLYLQNGRKSIRSDEWTEVAKKVNETSITPRTEAQCRNRLDTLKKKYKKEMLRIEETMNSTSNWVYFKKMEELMGLPTPSPALRNHHQPRVVSSGDYVEYAYPTNSRNYSNQMNGLERRLRDGSEQLVNNQNGEDLDESDDDESDGLPPQSNKKSKSSGFLDSSSSRMLAESINAFGMIYERIEKSRMKHLAELERMRRDFHRDLEMQRRTILERAQEELQKLRQEDEESEDGDDDNNANDNDEIDGSADNPSSREH
ncbi:hypothetical protein ZOSMA_84G00020 [Zostera marina]|uniref:Myb/SANT-like DNA-binding domain-containing protein n=1 Tax=Zostera marina TaxID=29655 RepID=A0A0K9NLB3_ZOSMR|nr:hypothetical protein ZOSMA_84G00020 [Zostera marina]